MELPDKNAEMSSRSLLQGNLPDSGIKSKSPALQADSLPSEPPGKLYRRRLWQINVKNQPIGKDCDVGNHCEQEEEWAAEDEMTGWYH